MSSFSSRRGSSAGAASIGGFRLRPLTQLKPDTPPAHAAHPAYPPPADAPRSAPLGATDHGLPAVRRASITASATVSSPLAGSPLGSFRGAGDIAPGGTHLSAHSRRGSMSASASHLTMQRSKTASPLEGAVRVDSVPSFTAGFKASGAIDPYALIEPGQEHLFLENRQAAAAAASAAAGYHTADALRAKAHAPVPVSRRASMVAGALPFSSGRQAGSSPLSMRRFTQAGPVSDPSRHSVGVNAGAAHAAAVHARRFSTIAREPSQRAGSISPFTGSPLPAAPTTDAGTDEDSKVTSDAQSLVISLGALLGRNGGAEGVGELLSLILDGGINRARDDFFVVLETASQGMSPANKAYTTVTRHELVKQLGAIGSLAVQEDEWRAVFSRAALQFPNFVAQPAAGETTSYSARLSAFTDMLAASPVYQSAFLKLLDLLCSFIVFAEPAREGLWLAFSEALDAQNSGSAPAGAVGELYAALVKAVEQLAGPSVRGLIKSLVEWAAVADEGLSALSNETHAFLSSELAAPPPGAGAYVKHPLGGVYDPAEATWRWEAVVHRWVGVGMDDEQRRRWNKVLRSWDHLDAELRGNSVFARFARDVKRVWSSAQGGAEEGEGGGRLDGLLEAARVLAAGLVEVDLGALTSAGGEGANTGEVRLPKVVVKASDLLPAELSWNSHSKLTSEGFVSAKSLTAKGVRLVAKGVEYLYSGGPGGLKDEGKVDLDIAFNVEIKLLAPGTGASVSAFSLPIFDGATVGITACGVAFSSTATIKDAVRSAVWPLIKSSVARRIEGAMQDWLKRTGEAWLPTAQKEPHAAAKAAAARRALAGTRTSQPAVDTTRRGPSVQGPPAGGVETHGTARDRFKASVRNLTGIKTDVVSQLQNPLSGPPSPVLGVTPVAQEEPIEKKKKRRQSMADFLTDTARIDSTLASNIERPPVARRNRLPSVFADDDDEGGEYETMAVSLSAMARKDTTGIDAISCPLIDQTGGAEAIKALEHRGALGELSYDQFAAAQAAYEGRTAYHPGDYGSMALSLSEVAARDATTPDSIAHPPSVDQGDPNGPDRRRGSRSMDQITRSLSGMAQYEHADADADARAGASHRPRSEPAQSPDLRGEKVVMARQLTKRAMSDNTLPENQATGDLSGPVQGHGAAPRGSFSSLLAGERVTMARMLTKEASVDGTLAEHIASPPGSRHPSFARSPLGSGSGSGSGSRPGSFQAPHRVLPMSAALDEAILRDDTTPEAQAALGGRGSPAGVAALTPQEMRRRRQSFKLSPEAMADGTALEAIRHPSVSRSVDAPPEESEMERVFRARRPSSVAQA